MALQKENHLQEIIIKVIQADIDFIICGGGGPGSTWD